MFRGLVVLVQPPLAMGASYHLAEPLGLLLTAGALRHAPGVERVVVVDQALELAEGTLPTGAGLVRAATDRLLEVAADVYAFSVQCVDLPIALAIARALKSARPDATLVFGGHQASLLGPEIRRAFPFVDHVVTGPGERAAGPLRAGASPTATSPAGPAAEWTLPAYDLAAPFERYAAVSAQPTGLVEVARGCPYDCAFCSIPATSGRRVTFKPVDRIMHELDVLADRGCTSVHLVHDTLTINPRFTAELLRALRRRERPVAWTGMTRADLTDPALLREMAAAGCEGLLVGVDAVEPATQKLISKRAGRYPAVVDLVRWHAEAGLASTFYFLVGFPGEDPASVEHALGEAARASVVDPGSCHVQYPRLVPGTPLGAAAGRDGLVLDLDSPYAQWLMRTAEGEPEVLDLVARHPAVFSTYYASTGGQDRQLLLTLAWTASKLLSALPMTLAALAELHALVPLFRAVGRRLDDPASLREASVRTLLPIVSAHVADTAPALLPFVRFEDWLYGGHGDHVSVVDRAAARAAVLDRQPVSAALSGGPRRYRRTTGIEGR
ncbi:B12-binding domain-containing radical SAM protein [Kitasatospora sp. NPDC008115]|uniref:B12-binding domain-containing radical SAM protein n=1 Tax=Kitasatospora sp. NPDC008115 TaxID=3364022 RepID=UPI0036E35A7C